MKSKKKKRNLNVPAPVMESQPKKKFGDLVTRLISVFALAISFGSLYLNYSFNAQNAESSAIKDVYSTFFDLDRLALNNWQLSHVFTTPEGYDSVKLKISYSVKTVSLERLIELNLKERALALQIFDYYEQTLYLLDHARRNNLKEREEFIQAVINYFCNRVLRNPRLLYFWTVLANDYETSTKEHYRKNVINSIENPLATKPDYQGPFYTMFSK